MATLDEAIDQMCADGMPPFPQGLPLTNTARIVRYGPKKKAWYRLYEVRGRNGKAYVHGAYGIFGALDSTKIRTDWAGLDEADRKRLENEQRAAAQREEEKRQARAGNAANRARQQYMAAAHEGKSPYLERKGVEPEKSVRYFDDGTLLVPMVRYDYDRPKLMGLQKISPAGEKRFTKGMAKDGTACLLGGKPKEGDPMLLAEGLATGLSIRMAINKAHPLFVAFDCGNLVLTARILREKYPKSPILVCADDDFRTICDRHQREGAQFPMDPGGDRPFWCRCNPGATKAMEAVSAVGNAHFIRPEFSGRAPDAGWTDFNDLHQAEGLETVARQISGGIFKLAGGKDQAGQGAKRRKPLPPEFWNRLDAARKSWVLIRGTDTIWDEDRAKIIKVSHLRLAEGEILVNLWLGDPARRTVEDDCVVFDPVTEVDRTTHVNLFTGMKSKPLPPGEGACARLLELLHYLCNEDEAVYDWVLRWTAYPLQHPGAKMQTSVVMHGPEGTGKNLWWRAVRAIYHPYSALITQRELEAPFNGWASRKLFVVGNEVVSRAERQHHVGYLKNLITEEEIHINEKHLPSRAEANHMQITFLSNEFHLLQISPDDRRYLIIRTPPKLAKDFYQRTGEELAAGGHLALYRYLLDLDLKDFTEHTEPIMTEAKRGLIELGKSSARLFYDELKAGLLPLPYGPCLSRDLYKAFVTWCLRNGDRMPMRHQRFGSELADIEAVTKCVRDVEDPAVRMLAAKRQQHRVFLMGAPEGEQSEDEWVKQNIRVFHSALSEYQKPEA